MNDFSTGLHVSGDPDAVASFAACVCAVGEHFNLPAAYEFVEALTGTCFSPCYNSGGKIMAVSDDQILKMQRRMARVGVWSKSMISRW